MGEWQRYPVDLGAEYETIQVEARQSADWVEWRGLPGTPMETWIGSGPRTHVSTAEQIQETAHAWFHHRPAGAAGTLRSSP
jgi:hypothetical protein